MNKLVFIVSPYKRFIFLSFILIAISTVLYLKFSNIVYASFGSWGDSSLIHGCKNSRGGVTIVGSSDTCNVNETEVTWLKDVDAGSGLTATRGSDGVTLSLSDASSGWTNASETWTYAAADSPSFTFTISGDKTGKYSPGMRVKLTQTTDKYFIITKVSYSSPDTTVTVYGGTDYTLANASITNPYFSTAKAPQGFPLDPAKWTVRTNTSSGTNQSPETANTWYNTGGVSLNVPIGSWRIFYQTSYGWEYNVTGNYDIYVTLSTSSSSQDDADMTSSTFIWGSMAGGSSAYREKFINLTSKATYYLLIKTGSVSGGSLDLGTSSSPPVIQAVSSYL
jgi:hypothetical protein